MELQEYHVKRIFKQFGLPVLKGDVAYTPEEVLMVADKLGKGPYLLKAQVVGGGSCYGRLLPVGSVEDNCVCVPDKENAKKMATDLLKVPTGCKDVNPLFSVQKLYVEEGIENACVLGRLVFRVNFEKQCETLTIEIEGKKSVSFLLKDGFELEKVKSIRSLLDKNVVPAVLELLEKAYRLFKFYGAVAVELSPIVQLKDDTLKVVDGRLVFDPNTTYKFPELVPLIEPRLGKEQERIARQNHFRYMGMKGNIACVVNGIGLGWATVDLVQRKGGKVGALLDVGTKPTRETVTKALRLILSEPNVDGVLVNIFGGLTRCDLIAEGLIAASPEMAAGLPFVIRMDGMNAEIGQRLLFESRLPFIIKTKMEEAVRSVIKEIKERR